VHAYRHGVPSSPSDVAAFVTRVRVAVEAGDVETTKKADDEMVELGWERSDLLLQLIEVAVR